MNFFATIVNCFASCFYRPIPEHSINISHTINDNVTFLNEISDHGSNNHSDSSSLMDITFAEHRKYKAEMEMKLLKDLQK